MHAQEYMNHMIWWRKTYLELQFMQVVLCQFLMINKSHGFCFVFVGLCVGVINWASTASLSSLQSRSRTHLVSNCHQWSQEVAINKKLLYKKQQYALPSAKHTHLSGNLWKKLSIEETLSIQSWWIYYFLPVTSWMTKLVISSCASPAHSVDGRNPPVDSVDR